MTNAKFRTQLLSITVPIIAAGALICASTQASGQQRQPAPLRELIMLKMRTGDYKLVAGGTRSTDIGSARIQECKDSSCDVFVEVIVDLDNNPTGRLCKWDYPEILVVWHKSAIVNWRLSQSSTPEAVFIKAQQQDGAGTGIDIHTGNRGKAHYDQGTHSPKTFSWKRKSNTLQVLKYDFNVEHGLGEGSGRGRCDVPDPLIINMD